MARPRRPENAWMPRWVERYPKGYRVKRRGSPTHHLAGADASRSEVWAAYERWQKGEQEKPYTVADLVAGYFGSPMFAKRSPQTQKDYRRYSKRIIAVFGNMHPDQITSPAVQLFMDARGEQYPTAANRERTFLGIVMKWGKARGFVKIEDPTEVVRPFQEESAGEYIADENYSGFFDWLGSKGHTQHQCAMEIAYLCGSRQQDVLALTTEDLYEEGVLIYQQKTKKVQIKRWTPDLEAAIKIALAANPQKSKHVIRSRSGNRYTRTGFNSTWGREMREALASGAIQKRFRFHDLKVKGVSDFEGDKQYFSGHTTRSMMERYNVTPDVVDSVDRTKLSKRPTRLH